jgi:hypothetical protein
MAMKFRDEEMDTVYHDYFRPALAEVGLDLNTTEEQPEAGLLDYRIRLQVTASRIVIADLTHQNQGVYFEAGYADGLGRPVVYTCKASEFKPEEGKPHFDVNHQTFVLWSFPPRDAELDNLKVTVRNSLLTQDRVLGRA